MAEFTMPSLGADMDEGTLQEWLVGPGDQVRKGDPVAVVETAKSTIEVECFATGTIGELLVEPGTTVPVGTALALIERATEPVRKSEKRRKRAKAKRAKKAEEEGPVPTAAPHPKPHVRSEPARAPASSAAHERGHIEAGPLARHLAERSGIELGALHGTGRGGRLTRTDVEQASSAAGAASPPPRVRATPQARRLAAELDVDLAAVTGTGRDSAVRATDVRRAAPGPASTAPSQEQATTPVHPSEDRAAAMRRAIAALMTRANRDIPHYYLSTTIDMAAGLDWLHEHNRRVPVAERLLPAALLLKATALAARQVPELNGFWTDDHFTAGEGVHLGVAVSLRGGGLVAPALHDADTLELPRLMAALKDVVIRTRTGRLRGSEVSDSTLTVTNLGDQGVESVLGVIYPPQVALVGFGRIEERPRAVEGLLGVRPVVTATLSADHRATDGAVGARYLTAVDHLLQNPEQL
ncbi:dihydrolipoamide acetyltransferase family protein [Streptomyces umbrinus]|uniref:dihydrolipoamide acetyltransferase family protein n=1 Tax=Streptomyces umbrinus TaxID=67370 RepID=UPI0033D864B6